VTVPSGPVNIYVYSDSLGQAVSYPEQLNSYGVGDNVRVVVAAPPSHPAPALPERLPFVAPPATVPYHSPHLGNETHFLPPEALFNMQAGSLGPPPSGALSVSQVESANNFAAWGQTSQVDARAPSSWRARLRSNGVQQLGEVEAALRRRVNIHSGEIPASNGQLWPGDPSARYGSDGPVVAAPPPCPMDAEITQMSVQMPPAWHGNQGFAGGRLVPCPTEADNQRMSWQAPVPPPAENPLWHMNPPLLNNSHHEPPATMPYSGFDYRGQLAAQLRVDHHGGYNHTNELAVQLQADPLESFDHREQLPGQLRTDPHCGFDPRGLRVVSLSESLSADNGNFNPRDQLAAQCRKATQSGFNPRDQVAAQLQPSRSEWFQPPSGFNPRDQEQLAAQLRAAAPCVYED